MKIATVKTDERIMRPWVQIAKRHGEVVVLGSEDIKTVNDLFRKLKELDSDVIYCHSVMALHDVGYLQQCMQDYDCVVFRIKGCPTLALNLIGITRKGLQTLSEYAERFTPDDTISQEANCHTLLLQALGQSCLVVEDMGEKVLYGCDNRLKGTVGTYVGGESVMRQLSLARLDVYDVLGYYMENMSVDRKEVKYAE